MLHSHISCIVLEDVFHWYYACTPVLQIAWTGNNAYVEAINEP